MTHAEYQRQWRSCNPEKARAAQERYRKGPKFLSERSIWYKMVSRCHNREDPAYRWYGRRGIRVCKDWRLSFEVFLSQVGRRPKPGLTLDRIDNDGHYEPGNVRWATRKEQAVNSRKAITYALDGVRDSLTGWEKRFGLPLGTLRYRLKGGRGFYECLLTPAGSDVKLSALHIPLADLLGEISQRCGVKLDGEKR